MVKHISEEELSSLAEMADWMDSRFKIPFTSIRFGLDSLLGFIPVVGDSVTMISTAYLMKKAHEFELPMHVKFVMLWNLLLDWLVGIIPFLGDLFDIGFKANKKNVALIHKYAARGNDNINSKNA